MELEERLPGGNVGGAWKVGHTVRRPTGPWTPAVHALLNHLAGRLDGVPGVHGFDEQGREVLDYLPGQVVDDPAGVSAARLRAIAEWTARFHAAVTGFDHAGPWRMPAQGTADVVGHNDIAYYNLCFDGDRVSGVFDWDLAGPTTRLLDVAFLAWNGVPLWRDLPPVDVAHRLQIIADGYGDFSPAEILTAVPERIRATIRVIEQGESGFDALADIGEPDLSRKALADLERRLPDLISALS